MQHHFVVYFDDVTKTWHVDAETTDSRFNDGNVWAEDKNHVMGGEWVYWNDDTSEVLNSLIDLIEVDSESDEPKKKTRDEMLAESESNYKCPSCGTDCTAITCLFDETDWCDYCQMDVKGDESGCCPHCGYLVTDLIEETDYLEEDDE